ncbi:MAG: hypothetical protein AMJ93_15355 [Anaerolineae bacterium SM23_84]|jgi:hypothetical protein|nr:MAG: hypothetical protein AMJ93_15355 [Anaerolineae bacterium SM23_84]
MAKKTRRSRRKRKTAQTRVAKTRKLQPTPVKQAAVSTEVSAPAKLDLAQEYHYVFSDLRRIAIIAAVMFALLLALAFVLR